MMHDRSDALARTTSSAPSQKNDPFRYSVAGMQFAAISRTAESERDFVNHSRRKVHAEGRASPTTPGARPSPSRRSGGSKV